jgi:hypothetical protein
LSKSDTKNVDEIVTFIQKLITGARTKRTANFMKITPGMQVVFTNLIDRWPAATILVGEIGEIVDITDAGVRVRLALGGCSFRFGRTSTHLPQAAASARLISSPWS